MFIQIILNPPETDRLNSHATSRNLENTTAITNYQLTIHK